MIYRTWSRLRSLILISVREQNTWLVARRWFGVVGPCQLKEYARALREQHRRSGGEQTLHPKIGDVIIIRGDAKNRNHWKLGAVEELIQGRDGITRGAKVKTSNGILERATQHLSPLELSCDRSLPVELNPTAPEFMPRPRRDAAAAARLRIQNNLNEEDND
jgi:hypothetical protein